MCREHNNKPELSLVFNQFRRRANDLLLDLHEWKHHCKHQKQNEVSQQLEVAEEKFDAAIKALEEVLKRVDLPPQKEKEEFTINVISK